MAAARVHERGNTSFRARAIHRTAGHFQKKSASSLRTCAHLLRRMVEHCVNLRWYSRMWCLTGLHKKRAGVQDPNRWSWLVSACRRPSAEACAKKGLCCSFFQTACFCWEAKILSPNDTVKDLPAALVEAGENCGLHKPRSESGVA